jgi:hypothetical protein
VLKKSVLIVILVFFIVGAIFLVRWFQQTKMVTYHLPREDQTNTPSPVASDSASLESLTVAQRPVVKLKTAKRAGSEQPLKETVLWKYLEEDEIAQKEDATIRRAKISQVILPAKEFEIELLLDGVKRKMIIGERTSFAFPEYEFDENGNIIYVNYSSAYSNDLLATLQENSLILIYVVDPTTLQTTSPSTTIVPRWIVSAE